MAQSKKTSVTVPLFGKPVRQGELLAFICRGRIEEFLKRHSFEPSTKEAYFYDLETFLNWSGTSWESVESEQVAQFKSHLMCLEDGRRMYSDTTVARMLGTLRNFYEWMQKTGYVTRNPAIAVDLPKLPEPEALNLSNSEMDRILKAIHQTSLPERNLALIVLIANGLRPSDPCKLNVGDFDGVRVYIRQAKTDSKEKVPLRGWAIAALKSYLDWRVEQGEEITPQTPLFVSYSNNNKGQRITYDTVRKLVEQLGKIVGFKFNARQLRHTFATKLVQNGMSPCLVQILTRHKDPRSLRRYAPAADYAAAEEAFLRANSESPDWLRSP